MSRTHTVVRGALLLGVATTVFVGCQADHAILGLTPSDPMFLRYVALGNSITAGYQSGGINDSTQKQSYALLLAKQMNTRYAYPSLTAPGCPPPVNNLLTQTRVGTASTSTTCALRATSSSTLTLNNVAVPGIASADPTAVGGTAANSANALVELILGGKTMVQKALDVQPTFASIWVGNNDILGPATSGLPSTATAVNTFQANYGLMMTQLLAGAPQLKGVLIGVVQVAQVPLLFQAGVLANPTVAAAAAQVAGRPVTLDPTTCAGTNAGALVAFPYLVAIRNRPAASPGTVFCQPVAGGGATDPGDAGILDLTEQAFVSARITAYNAYIKAKADSIGFAYYDPNTTLGVLKADPTKIPVFPNLAAPTTTPFGQYFSLDGVHPSALAHTLIANDIIAVINTKYGTSLATLP